MQLAFNAPNGYVGQSFDAAAAFGLGQHKTTFFCSGIPGVGFSCIVEGSPDLKVGGAFAGGTVADTNSRWFEVTTFTGTGQFVTSTDKFRKFRCRITGGDNTTNVTVEGV